MRSWTTVCLILFLSILCPAKLRADLNGDCRVDIADLAILMSEWLQEEDCNMSLGPELTTNGGLDTDTWWEKLNGATISGGVARLLNGSTLKTPDISLDMPNFSTYRLTYTMTFVQFDPEDPQLASVTPILAYNAYPGTTRTTEGTFTEDVVIENYTGAPFGEFRFYCSDSGVQYVLIDNVSFKRVLPDGGITMDVFEDME